MARSSLLKGFDRFLLRLSRRERWILGGGGLVTLLLVGYVTFLGPAWERMVQLDRLIPQKEKEVGEFANLREDYTALSSGIQKIERRLPTQNQFSPLSFLEENATKNQMRANIAYIRPLPPQVHEPYREIPVEVKVENVSLARMISFLSAIENAPHTLRIKRLTMKTRFSDPALMDITFVVSSYEKITT